MQDFARRNRHSASFQLLLSLIRHRLAAVPPSPKGKALRLRRFPQKYFFDSLNARGFLASGIKSSRRIQHIFNENPVSRRRVINKNMGHSTHNSPILDHRTPRHERVNIGTTNFDELFKKFVASLLLRVK